MRLLYVCNQVYWDRKVPRTRFHAIEAMREYADVHCTGVGFPDWDDKLPIGQNLPRMPFRPDWIFIYKPDQYTGWDTLNIPVVTSFNDAWATRDRLHDILLPMCKVVVMHHANEMAEWQERCPDIRFVNIPYPINPEVFKDYGLPKTIDILLTGAVDEKIYPLRYRLAELIKRGAFAPFKAVWQKHCGYRLDDPEAEAVRYARQLNSARVCLADTSCYLYAAEKYHEIPACRSVLCGNMPGERQYPFLEFMWCIDGGMSDETIVGRVKALLESDNTIKILSNTGYEYVHSNHTVRHYAKRFIESLS